MLLHLFTAGVLLTSALMVMAFTASGALKARVMLKASAVRLRGISSVGAEVFDFVCGGGFASGHVIEHVVHVPRFARVEDVRRVMMRPLANKTCLGFIGYPPYQR